MSTEPLLGAIKWVAFDFAPRGWALCNGQLLPISPNHALFSLLGIKYGGDGRTTFALPDLRGRTPIGWVAGNDPYALGAKVGAEAHTLTVAELPRHTHFVGVSDGRAVSNDPGPATPVQAGGSRAFVDREIAEENMSPAAVSSVGGGQPHDNMQPYLTLNAVIALDGIYPGRS